MINLKFFQYMPGGSSAYFGIGHILFILFGTFGSLLICFLLRKLTKERSIKILKVISIVGLTLDPIYWIWEYMATGKLNIVTTLPLYFCSLFYLTMPFAFFCKNKFVKQTALSYLATMNLIAGLMGLIFNTHLVNYPVFSFVGLRTMIYHTLMVFTSIFIWTSKVYVPKIHDTYLFFIPVTLMFFPALITDIVLNADYCFLGGGIGTPFEIISKLVSLPFYVLILYSSIYFLVNIIFYIPTIVRFLLEKKSERNSNCNFI